MLTLGVFSVIALVSIPSLATQVLRHPSRVTISEKAPAFHGRVKSNAHPCVQRRKVKLFLAKRHAPDKFLGRDHTNNHGRWQVEVNPLKSGAYYAKVSRRSEAPPARFTSALRTARESFPSTEPQRWP